MAQYDLIIVGTGSGNSILDERFAGWRVAVVEAGTFGGTCLNVGCIPTKMFVHAADVALSAATGDRLGVDSTWHGVRWAEVRDRIFGRIDPIAEGGRAYRREHPDNAHVTVYEATARFTAAKTLQVTPTAGGEPETISAERIVLAAGGRAVAPEIPGLADVAYHTSDTIMRIDQLPDSIVIIGGGFIAAEFAHVLSAFGVDVTVVNRSPMLLRTHDTDIAARFTALAEQRWNLRLGATPTAVRTTGDGIAVDLATADGSDTVEGQELLVATGRTPNTDALDVAAGGIEIVDGYVKVDDHQQTSVPGIYALGDIASPHELKHVANHEAKVVQHNLLYPDQPRKSDHRFVPHAVFTHPQIAAVGVTEQQAVDRGLRYVTATQDYGDIAYGWAMEDTTGFVKLLADPDTGQLLGAHLIGPQAPTVIQPLIQAMSFGLDAASMATGQYWIHPAMPEVVENALLKLPLHAAPGTGSPA